VAAHTKFHFRSCLFSTRAANVQGLGSIPSVYLERRLGRIPAKAMLELKRALLFALDLSAMDLAE